MASPVNRGYLSASWAIGALGGLLAAPVGAGWLGQKTAGQFTRRR